MVLKLIKLKVERFKGFEEFEMDLGDFNVVVGPNNAGKSSLLQAIMLAHECQRLTVESTPNGLAFASRAAISLESVPLGRFKDLWYNHKNRTGNQPLPVSLALTFEIGLDDGTRQHVEIRYNIKQVFTGLNVSVEPSSLGPEAEPILNWKPLYVPGFVGVVAREDRYRPISTENYLRTGRQNQVLRNIIYDAYEAGHGDRILSHLQELFGIKKFEIPFDENTDLYLRAQYLEDNQREPLDLVSIGSGFLQVAQILSIVYSYRPSMILLDEGDAHLHSSMQRRLVHLLRKLQAELNCQIVIATHAEHFIRSVPLEDLVYVDRRNPRALRPGTYRELNDQLHNAGISLDNVAYSTLVRTGKIIFVEARSDFNIYLELLHILYPDLQGLEADYWVQPTEGVSRPILQDLKHTLENITGLKLQALFIRDRDVLDDEELKRLNDAAETSGLTVLVGQRREIENYLLEVPVLVDAINKQLEHKGDERRVNDEVVLGLLKEAQEHIRDAEALGYAQPYAETHRRKGESHGEALVRGTQQFEKELQNNEIAHRVVRGSALLKMFRALLAERYNITSLTQKAILRSFTPDRIPADLKDLLEQLAEFIRPSQAD